MYVEDFTTVFQDFYKETQKHSRFYFECKRIFVAELKSSFYDYNFNEVPTNKRGFRKFLITKKK